jgi:conjugative relaxase-like TrwC/TraI family protein
MNKDKTLKAGIQSQKDYYRLDEALKRARQYSNAETQSIEHKVTIAQWMGTQSRLLGLVSEVEQQKFEQLLDGYLPGTSQRIRCDRKHGRENLAVDFLLCPPKSFSMHALKDPGLYVDHMEACRQTLAETEKRYCFLRIFIDGRQQNVRGNGFIAVAIPHWTSREDEMLLHTHILIINGVQGPNGKWRALDDRQLSYAEWQGVFYRRVLSKLTEQRGYRICETRFNDGGFSFEFEGVTRSQIQHFSTRSRQIAEAAAAKGVSRDEVVLLTRKAKRISKTWTEFQQCCIREMQDIGVVLQIPQTTVQVSPRPIHAEAEIEKAIRHYMGTTLSFRREDVYRYVLNHSASIDLSEIDQAIAAHPELIPATNPRRLTTVVAQEQEQRIIALWNHGQEDAQPILESRQALAALKGVGLNSGQAQAIAGVLAATDQRLILDGLTGTAKIIALRQIKQLAEQYVPDLTVHLLDSSSIDIEHQVLNVASTQKQLWIIDNAGTLTPHQIESFQFRANKIGTRILLVGDSQQSYSSRAGSAMRSLELHGATTFSVHKNVQAQKAIPKRAVKLMAAGQGSEALSLLVEHGYVKETEKYETLNQRVAQQWLALPSAVQAKTAIIAGTETERAAINDLVREGLRVEGKLGVDSSFVQLVSRPLSAEAKLSAANYKEGDYIRLRSEVEFVSLKQHQLYRVIGLVEDQLLVSTAGGRKYRFDPAQCDLEVFYTQNISIAVDDRLRMATDLARPGDSDFRVKKIDGQAIILKDAKGKTQTIDGSRPLQLDHAAVYTSAELHELNRKRVIFAVSDQTAAQNLPNILKTKEVQVYTDRFDQLRTWVAQTKNTLQRETNHESKFTRQHSARSVPGSRPTEQYLRQSGEQERASISGIASPIYEIQERDLGAHERPGANRTADSRRYQELAGRLCDTIAGSVIAETLWKYQGIARGASRLDGSQYGDITTSQRLAGAVTNLNDSIGRINRGISRGIEQRRIGAIAGAIQSLREDQAILQAIPASSLMQFKEGIENRDQDLQNAPEKQRLGLAIEKLNVFTRQYLEQPKAREAETRRYADIAEQFNRLALEKATESTLSKYLGTCRSLDTANGLIYIDLTANHRLTGAVEKLNDSILRIHQSISDRAGQRRISALADCVQQSKDDRDILQSIPTIVLTRLNKGYENGLQVLGIAPEMEHLDLTVRKLNMSVEQLIERVEVIKQNSDRKIYEQYCSQYDRLTAKVLADFPRESQEFIDTEVWLRAMSEGDERDGMRCVRAGATERGINADQYCKDLLSNGSVIRGPIITPDKIIIEFAYGLLAHGEQKPNGDRIYHKGIWHIHSRGRDLTIRRDGCISYQIKGGIVRNNSNAPALRSLAANVAALTQPDPKPKRGARR